MFLQRKLNLKGLNQTCIQDAVESLRQQSDNVMHLLCYCPTDLNYQKRWTLLDINLACPVASRMVTRYTGGHRLCCAKLTPRALGSTAGSCFCIKSRTLAHAATPAATFPRWQAGTVSCLREITKTCACSTMYFQTRPQYIFLDLKKDERSRSFLCALLCRQGIWAAVLLEVQTIQKQGTRQDSSDLKHGAEFFSRPRAQRL